MYMTYNGPANEKKGLPEVYQPARDKQITNSLKWFESELKQTGPINLTGGFLKLELLSPILF